MKKLFGILSIAMLLFVGCEPAIGQSTMNATKNIYPRWYQINYASKVPMDGSYNANALMWDTVVDAIPRDTAFLRLHAYHNIVVVDSLLDSIVFVIPGTGTIVDTVRYTSTSRYGGFLSSLYPDDEVIFLVQNSNDTVGTNTGSNKNHHKIKFRNKYHSSFLFSTAADSMVILSAKQRLYMTFKVIDPNHLLETGKAIR